MLNVYKAPTKEHQVVYSGAVDEISVLQTLLWKYLEYVALILCNYKKLKSRKINRSNISSILCT